MLLRILKNSFLKRPKAVILVLVSVILGSMTATAFLGSYRELSGKMALELRRYGANIVVEPAVEGGYLREDELPKIKSIFWRHNVTGFAPYIFEVADFSTGDRHHRGVLTGTWFQKLVDVEEGEPTIQGIRGIAPWWKVDGRWPAGPGDAVVGSSLARRLLVRSGEKIHISCGGKTCELSVVGIVTTGGYEEEQVFAPLSTVQGLVGAEGKVSRVLVSALTVPMDAFGERDPGSMSKLEYEKWYCTAYVTSVAKNVEEALTGSHARPIWQIAGAESSLLQKLDLVLVILTAIALVSAAIGVSSSLMASMAERRREIALMKAMGADRFQVSTIFLGETLFISLLGGIVGYVAGLQLAMLISRSVFGSPINSPGWLLPLALASAFVVAAVGSLPPLRKALVVEPVRVLKG